MKRGAIPAPVRSGVIALLALLFSACGPAPQGPSSGPEDLDPVARALRDLSGRRTRLVWLQDTADGTDYLARGDRLRLMGIDTDDGAGERVILPPGRNMAKPMFTVDGDRVVFSDRERGTMHIVDWSGGEPTELGEGFVLHTWRDPETRVEWIYYARPPVEDGKVLQTHQGIYRKALPPYPVNLKTLRARLRGRLAERPVWNQTPVSEDSYQLSADGRLASAPFPWPRMGVHEPAAERWHRRGRGCWVAMSPDNSYIFWIFDGAHRNLIMERVGGGEPGRWTVPVNRLPDADRYEVYHPRWSNHPRILAVSGPYRAGEGAYRLPGGGSDVEIWVGRFAEDHRSVERWVRATYNNHANFYPDVWVEAEPRILAPGRIADRSDRPRSDLTWPANKDGLVYLWEHGGGRNEIRLPEKDRSRSSQPEPRRLARLGGRQEMRLRGGYFFDAAPPGLAPPFAIEAALAGGWEEDGDGLVLGYDPDHGLSAVGGELVFRWGGQTARLGQAGGGPVTHIVVNLSDSRLEVFLDGEFRAEKKLVSPLPPAPGETLYFGGHSGAAAGWPGRLSHIALYRRVLERVEAERNHRLVREGIERTDLPESLTLRVRVVGRSPIPAVEEIAPYRRALVVYEYEVVEGARSGERILVAHWAILDGVVLEDAERPIGAEYDLALAPYDRRSELEGERLAMDVPDLTLELYYDLDRP